MLENIDNTSPVKSREYFEHQFVALKEKYLLLIRMFSEKDIHLASVLFSQPTSVLESLRDATIDDIKLMAQNSEIEFNPPNNMNILNNMLVALEKNDLARMQLSLQQIPLSKS